MHAVNLSLKRRNRFGAYNCINGIIVLRREVPPQTHVYIRALQHATEKEAR